MIVKYINLYYDGAYPLPCCQYETYNSKKLTCMLLWTDTTILVPSVLPVAASFSFFFYY
jgi:hypothetical protein